MKDESLNDFKQISKMFPTVIVKFSDFVSELKIVYTKSEKLRFLTLKLNFIRKIRYL